MNAAVASGMGWLLKAVTTGAVSFAATNIDDIFVLALFFGQSGGRLKVRHVVLGQYLGFSALVAVSLVGYFARLIVPPEWAGLLGLLPIAIGVRHLLRRETAAEAEPEDGPPRRSAAGAFSVAAVTFANGGDNIGIYTPLFAASDLASLLVVLAVFFVMLALWCAAGLFIGRHPAVKRTLERRGHVVVPFVLIGLGVYIIVESGTPKLLGVGL
jgi:cadmium resistance transport/sequestration family protein